MYPHPAQFSTRSASLWWGLALIAGALVIGNYLTATATYWQSNPFMNWIFTVSPIAIASQISLLPRKPSTIPVFLSVFVAVTIVISFGYAWISWFSPNPYEEFALMNVFFGPYGWMQWMWLALTGLLPLLYLVPRILAQPRSRRFMATVILLAHFHNAAYVIYSCHAG